MSYTLKTLPYCPVRFFCFWRAFPSYKAIVITAFFSTTILTSFQCLAANFVGFNTGNWGSRSTWVTTKTGTITVASGATSINGSGTAFTTEVQVGDRIYRDGANSFTLIGTVASITSNTQLTLTAGATAALSNVAWYSHGVPGAADDVQIGYYNGTVTTTITVDGGFTCNTVHFVQNNGAEHRIDIPASMSLTVNGYVFIVSTNNSGTVNTLNVSGTLTAANLYQQGTTQQSSNAVSQVSIQNGGIINISGDININKDSRTAKMIIRAFGTGTLNMGGNFISTTSTIYTNTPYTTLPLLTTSTTLLTGTNNFDATSTINLNGVNKLQVLVLNNSTYGNVHFNNTGNNVATIHSNVTATNVLGNVRIQSGTVTNQGASSSTTLNAASTNSSYAGNAGKTFEVANGATMRQAGVASWPTGFGTYTVGNTSTVEYIGTTQTIENRNFGNLIITAGASTGRSVTLSGSVGIFGTFSPSPTNVYTITNSTIAFNGTGLQTMPADFTTYNNLTVNNSSGITLPTNITVNGVLALTSGNIITGSHRLYLGASGSVSRTSGHVVGNFRKHFATGPTARTFEIGDANNYTPVTVTFGNVTTAGDLTASTTVGDHPNIGSSAIVPSKTANRYWSLNNTGITFTNYNAVFTFVPGDLDAGANPIGFYIGKYDGSWTYPSIGTRGATSTELTGVTSFSDFQLGESSLYVLPVTMISFTAETKHGSIVLSWVTANEQTVDRFEIQKSTDGINYIVIGQKAAANSVHGYQYTFKDPSPSSDAYYRIRTIDQDDKFSYSKTIFIKDKQLQKASLLAQSFGNTGILIFNKSQQGGFFKYRLFNINGSQMLNGNIAVGANSATTIPINKLPAGVYVIELFSKEFLLKQKLFIGL